MAVEFNGSNYITLLNYPIFITPRTITLWVYLDKVTGTQLFLNHSGVWSFGMVDNDLNYFHRFDSDATWLVNDILTTDTWYHVAVSYDPTNAANDPVIYINGTARALSVDNNSTGSQYAPAVEDLKLGTDLDGKIEDPRIYNRILADYEVAELYNSRMQNKIINGLVFWPEVDGAKGLSTFDGTTLTAANTILDKISGAVGVPSGSPVGRGNTIQRIK